MKALTVIWFAATVAVTAYENIRIWSSALVLLRYGERWPIAASAALTAATLAVWVLGIIIAKRYIF